VVFHRESSQVDSLEVWVTAEDAMVLSPSITQRDRKA
jgi:hypothetical protein